MFMSLPPDSVDEGILFLGSSPTFVHSSRQILLPQYLMNGLSNPDEFYREYSLAPTDDPIRFWRSKVKVTAGSQGAERVHVSAEA